MIIKSNKHWHKFVYRYSVPEEVLKDQFSHQAAEEAEYGFFCFQGYWYHLSDFTNIFKLADNPLKDWDGYHANSAFSGVVINLSQDSTRYQVGTYYS